MAEVEQMTPPNVETPKDNKGDDKSSKKKSSLKLNLIVILVSQLALAGGGFFMVNKFIASGRGRPERSGGAGLGRNPA